MIHRICNLSKNHSFFLFGARGVGKSTFLEKWFQEHSVMIIDLLDPILSQRYILHPKLLISDWENHPTEWIFIDEIQKNPMLLDIIQQQMRKGKIKFALTGSSARKLKRGSANLLGGRAHEFHMHPLTHVELEKSEHGFHLQEVLSYGSLPYIVTMNHETKVRSLYSYITTYLREEILIEQIIRKINPFQKFLEAAAQMNGKILNYAKISRDSGVEERSVARYFQILEDTLLGFFLYPFENSVRKQQAQKAKFYFFDTGVTRTLQNQITLPLQSHTNVFGELFEQFVILECFRLNDYYERHYKFNYFRSKNGVEADLIITRPGLPTVLLEIKSKDFFDEFDGKHLLKIRPDFPQPCELMVLSNNPKGTITHKIHYLHWKEGLSKIFHLSSSI